MADESARTPGGRKLRSFLLDRLHFSQGTLLMFASIAIGLAAGLAALVFESGYHWLNSLLLEPILRNEHLAYLIIVVPAVGGLLVGLLMKLSGQNANGHGVPEVIESVNLRVGLIRFRKALAKTIAAIFTLGFGGSAGPEGPMVHLGSALGSVGGRAIGSSEEHTKVMISCGAAAGLAAIFHAPITGVIFVLEVILVDFSLDAFIPIILASITASVVARATWGEGALLSGSSYTFQSLWEVPLYVVLGLLCALLSVSFVKFFKEVESFWRKLAVPASLKPALGGLLVGVVAYKFPHILSDGYGTINTALSTAIPVGLVLILIAAKLVMTSMTLGSGGSGGMFAPTLFLGAMTGSVFGALVGSQFPQLGVAPGAFALVGMGAAMAGTLFAPVTAVIMIFEVTNNYYLILPLMIASIASLTVARRFTRDSIYTIGLSRKGIRLHGGRDENLLRSMSAGDIMRKDFPIVCEDWPLARIFDQLSKSPYSTLPVADRDGKFVGILPFETLRHLINENALSWLVIGKDLFRAEVATLRPDEDLRDALAKFAAQNVDDLPVLSDGENSKILGMLSRDDLLRAYNHELLRREAGRTIFETEPIEFFPYVRNWLKAAGNVVPRLLSPLASSEKPTQADSLEPLPPRES